VRAAGAVLGTALLTACGAAPSGAGATITLTFQGAYEPELYAALLPEFEATHRGLRVAAVLPPSPATRDTELVEAFVAGSGPDVFWSDAPWVFAPGPWLLDLLPLVRRDGYDLGAFSAGQLLATTWQGGLHGLPRTTNPAVFAARPDVFAHAGLALPEGSYSASELAALWTALSVPGQRVGGELNWSPSATYYLRGFGGHLVDPSDNLRCTLDTPQAIACGQWIWDRFWRDASARGLQGQNGWATFASGSLAMVVVNAAELPGLTVLYANLPWRLAPFPRWPAGPATSTTSEFYAIHAGTPHPEAAWELLQFVTSARWEEAAVAALLLPPARRSLWPGFLASLRHRVPALANQPLELFAAGPQGGWTYPPETFRYQAAALAVLNPYWQRIFAGAHALPVPRGFAAAAPVVTAAETHAAHRAAAARLP
jgi:multiple sugar transport system substrate-binding protein